MCVAAKKNVTRQRFANATAINFPEETIRRRFSGRDMAAAISLFLPMFGDEPWISYAIGTLLHQCRKIQLAQSSIKRNLIPQVSDANFAYVMARNIAFALSAFPLLDANGDVNTVISRLNIEHPFIFLLYDVQTGAILFMGKMVSL